MKIHFIITKFSLIVLFLLSISSCKKEEVVPCETLKNIVGTWKLDQNWESYTFRSDYTFIDSIFSGENNDILEWVSKGKFKFINGFLELSDVRYLYLKNSYGLNYRYDAPIYKFEIIDNKLFMNEINIFHSIDHSAFEINGKWQSTQNILIFEDNQIPHSVSGKRIVEYDFNEKSNTYTINYTDYYRNSEYTSGGDITEYRFQNPFIYRVGYDDPILKLDNGFLIGLSDNARRTYTKLN